MKQIFYLCKLDSKKPLELCFHEHATENQLMHYLASSFRK